MKTIRIGHSPDPDDAFMFCGLANGAVALEGFEVQQVLEEIDALNRRAMQGELEVTAISAGAYPYVADQYRIMACGASVGRDYGPIAVSRSPMSRDDLGGARIAVPGEYTTAYLLARIFIERPFEAVFLPFDQVDKAVEAGEVDAGLIIHEGQITWKDQGFHNVLDLGAEWGRDTGLPIPLGLDVVNRRLGEDLSQRVTSMLAASIRYALDHEDTAVEYALPFGRGIDPDTCRRFVRMYVNQDTVHMGDEGKLALETLYARAHERGLIATVPPIDIIEP